MYLIKVSDQNFQDRINGSIGMLVNGVSEVGQPLVFLAKGTYIEFYELCANNSVKIYSIDAHGIKSQSPILISADTLILY